MPQPDKNRRHILKYGMGTLGALGIFGAGVSTARPSQTKVTDKFDGLKSLYSQHSQKALANAEGINTLSPAPDPEVRALRRLTFGYRPEDREYFDSLGASFDERLENYVDEQLNGYQPGYPPINDPQLNAVLSDPLTAWETLDDSLETQWQERTLSTDNSINSHLPRYETQILAIHKAVSSRWQLAEILSHFWHNHFSVDGRIHHMASTFVHYDRDVIRPNMLGNFRQMLEAVTKSTTMMFYLDNVSNSKYGPNENYARELQELHTLGAVHSFGFTPEAEIPTVTAIQGSSAILPAGLKAGYSEEDVRQVTLALTGWTISNDWTDGLNTGTFIYLTDWHDTSSKRVLGIDISASGQDEVPQVLDLLAVHPNTARYVCTKLCRRLVNDHPPESLIEKAASVFNDQWLAPDQLKQVVKTIILSDEFRDAGHWGSKVKKPFELIVGAARSCGGFKSKLGTTDWSLSWLEIISTSEDHYFSTGYFFGMEAIGSMPFTRSTPDGFPDVQEAWLASSPLIKGWELINSSFNESYFRDVERTDWYTFFPVDAVETTKSIFPTEQRTATNIVDIWINRLLGYDSEQESGAQINTAVRDKLIAFMLQDADNPDVVFDLDGNPGDGSIWQDYVPERLQTLVASIAMLPDNLLR